MDKDLIEQVLNNPGDEPKYLLWEGGYFTSLLELGRAKSQHNLDIYWFLLLPADRLTRPGDMQVTKTSLQQTYDSGLQSL